MDLTQARSLVVEIVKRAGDIVNDYLSKGFSVHSKGGSDFATEADLAVDAFLQKELAAKFPGTSFLTEETAKGDLQSFIEKENLWVIDPIDGTTNFSRGNDHFAISVGLVDQGKPKLGVVYLPLENKLYTAQQDADDALLNDSPIHVSKTPDLQQALISCDWSWNIEKRKQTLGVVQKILPEVRALSCRGSAASDIASVGSGNIDAYFNFGLFPWDVAASLLIAEKAGAAITSLQGDSWSVFSSDILVTNGKLDSELRSYFS